MRPSVLVLVVTVCLARPCLAQDPNLEGLRGQTAMGVVVQPLKDLGNRLLQENLRTVVELKLRQNGITVDADFAKSLRPYLSLSVDTLKLDGENTFVYTIRLELFRLLITPGTDPRPVTAAVWYKIRTGVIPANELRDLRVNADEMVDGFLNDYLKVNPKK